jgi:hypothetical protein
VADISGFSWQAHLRYEERGPQAARLEVTTTTGGKDAPAIAREGGRVAGVR